MKLFISYSRDDKAWVYELWRALRDELHHDVWIDRRLVAASDWWGSICENVENCECFIYIITPKSIDSIYYMGELNYAIALNKPILPLMLKPCTFPAVLSAKRVQYETFNDEMSMDKVLLRLSMSLSKVREDVWQGVYPARMAERPDVPRPSNNVEQVFEVFTAAEEAAAEGNFSLAEQLFVQVQGIDPDGLGEVAKERLKEIKYEQERYRAYVQIARLANNPQTLKGARTAWRTFKTKYDADYDPDNLIAVLEAKPVPPSATPPPRTVEDDPIPAPPRTQGGSSKAPSPSGEGVGGEVETRLRTFSGRRNADWIPYITTLPEIDAKIPGMEFCLVPGGTFQMGSDDRRDDEKPVHPQTLQPYWIARYPVTNAQWRRAVAAKVVAEPRGDNAKKWYNDDSMADAPVVGITWFEAQKFCAWLGARLPTEPEWEYAARGVDGLVYPWGNDFVPDSVVYDGNSGGKPHAVTSKPDGKSWVGAMHLSGNVWEWCSSLYLPYPYDSEKVKNNSDDTNLRVLRGGSFVTIRFMPALSPATLTFRTTGPITMGCVLPLFQSDL